MNKATLSTVILILFCFAGFSGGAAVEPMQPRLGLMLEPGLSVLASWKFKGGERASVIGIGQGSTALGLYIYDEHGNCVTWDDMGTAKTKDDVAVEWFPARTAFYTVELRNFGVAMNRLDLAVR
jgi:hypothetical protein